MASITITFTDEFDVEKTSVITYPDEMVGDIPAAFAATYGWPANVPNPDFDDTQPIDPMTNPHQIANPQAKEDFVVVKMVDYVMHITADFQKKQALRAAEEAIEAAAEAKKAGISIDIQPTV